MRSIKQIISVLTVLSTVLVVVAGCAKQDYGDSNPAGKNSDSSQATSTQSSDPRSTVTLKPATHVKLSGGPAGSSTGPSDSQQH